MIRRLLWFLSGVAAGAYGVLRGLRKVRRSTEAMKPANVARDVAQRVQGRAEQVADALRAGRAAMQQKERELRAESGLDDEYADVVNVEPGRVVLLRPGRGRAAGVQRRQ